jgi:hypothetical protein
MSSIELWTSRRLLNTPSRSNGAHAGGLEVELLGGQCRQRQLARQRIGRLVHGIPFPSVSERRDGRDRAADHANQRRSASG